VTITPETKSRLEAAGHEAALSHIETLTDHKTPFGQIELLEIHRLIFARSWPDIAGRFRTENVELARTSYIPPHWQQVPILTHQALGRLNYRLSAMNPHPLPPIVALAAEAHYNLAAIHPFRDGNGRVARLVLNYVFLYFELPYVVIPSEKRDRYVDTLEAANRGDLAPFTDLVAEQYERSLDQMLGQRPDQTSTSEE